MLQNIIRPQATARIILIAINIEFNNLNMIYGPILL
jgi:hypothetical protein